MFYRQFFSNQYGHTLKARTLELIECTQACNRLAEISNLVGKKEPRPRFIDCPPLAEWRKEHTHDCVLL
jgi:hypothetical protein